MAGNKDFEDKNCAEVAKREIHHFLQVTALKSIQFARHSAHWIESMFWIVLLLGGTAYAIRDVQKAWEKFANEETYTSMSVSGLRRLTFEKAIICVEYDPGDLSLSNPRLLEYANTSKTVELATTANKSAVEFLSSSLKLLTVISLIENGRSADYEDKVAMLMEHENVQELQTWLLAHRVSIFDLGSTVGNWLCQAVQIRIYTLKQGALKSSVNPCEQEKITWLGVIPFTDISMSQTAVCVDVGGKIAFERMGRIVVTLNTSGLFSWNPSFNRTTEYVLNSYLDFSGDPVSTDLTKSFLQFPSRGCSSFGIGVDAEMHLSDRKFARCDPTAKTQLACFASCDVHRYEKTKNCYCTQLAWRYLYETGRAPCFNTHTIQEHIDCRHTVHRTNVSASCFSECLFPCEHRQFGVIDIEGCDEAGIYGDEVVALELAPKQFTVPVFEERLTLTVSTLFSRIGGTCGLWLGVGMLGICHTLLFPLKLLLKLLFVSAHTNVPTAVGLAEVK